MDISNQSQGRINNLLSMNPGALAIKISTNIKNPAIFKQFLMGGVRDNQIMDYAVAAGLLTRADAKWIKEHANGKEGQYEEPPAEPPADPSGDHESGQYQDTP